MKVGLRLWLHPRQPGPVTEEGAQLPDLQCEYRTPKSVSPSLRPLGRAKGPTHSASENRSSSFLYSEQSRQCRDCSYAKWSVSLPSADRIIDGSFRHLRGQQTRNTRVYSMTTRPPYPLRYASEGSPPEFTWVRIDYEPPTRRVSFARYHTHPSLYKSEKQAVTVAQPSDL